MLMLQNPTMRSFSGNLFSLKVCLWITGIEFRKLQITHTFADDSKKGDVVTAERPGPGGLECRERGG